MEQWEIELRDNFVDILDDCIELLKEEVNKEEDNADL